MNILAISNGYVQRIAQHEATIVSKISVLNAPEGIAPATMIHQFLTDTLPAASGAFYCLDLPLPHGGPGNHLWCSSIQELGAEMLLASHVDQKQCWFSPALFNEGSKQRTAENVSHLKTMKVDLDVGQGASKYLDQQTALAALDAFSIKFGLTPTWTISSGGGLHAYWCFKDAVPVSEWKALAERFKAVLAVCGVLADPAVTADPSRLMRPIGSIHRKDPKAPKWVWPITPRGQLTTFEAFAAAVARNAPAVEPNLHAEWSGRHQAGISKPLTTSGTERPTGVAAVLIGLGNPKKHPWSLAEATAMLACIDPDIEEPEWWSTLNQLAEWSDGCPEASGLCKRWSRGDLHGRQAEQWDEGAFEKKWKRAVESVGREGNAGWTSLMATVEGCGYVAPAKSQFLTADGDVLFANAEPGDIVAASVYALATRDKLIYVNQAGRWLRWDGTRWAWCDRGEEMAYAKSTADLILQWAADLVKKDKDKHQKRLSAALRLQNLPRLEAMIELAKSEPGMCVGQMTELDSDPWLLGVRNGVVNLHDGGLLAPDPKMLMTRQAAAEYRHDAECPRWLAFLDSIFEGDAETVAFIQRALGYTLTGVTTEEALFICFGFGANGKSVFGNVVSAILADYAQAAPPSLLTVRRDGDAGPRNDIARLCGARLVSINETQNGDRLDEQIVKMLAGREPLSARFLHKEYFDFLPTAKPWLRTNHRPIVTGDDDGAWRRLHLVPFRRKFAEDERDPWLEQKILEERDGILAWMVRGCLEWQRNGLNPSTSVRRESAAYRKESDLLGEFLEEKTAGDQTSRVEQIAMFCAWRVWNEINGTRHGSKSSFTRKLSERGFEVGRSNGSRFYTGLRLL
jgi:P4 family phage/plasmid primase-like protien